MTETIKSKVLLIYMANNADALAIGIPAVQYLQTQYPDHQLEVLVHGLGVEIFHAIQPETSLITLKDNDWPEAFLPAIESFLGLAEQLIGHEYEHIINIDTGFMCNFLARFLKDAGEPVIGNQLSISFDDLFSQFKGESLSADYVNIPENYIQSSFFGMTRWFSQWWLGDNLPEGGYPEFYLRKCCGFDSVQMEVDLPPNLQAKDHKDRSGPKILLLDFANDDDGSTYPYAAPLSKTLETEGFRLLTLGKIDKSIAQYLEQFRSADLLITRNAQSHWFAKFVKVPTLLISGSLEPTTLMPDFATDPHAPCPKHNMLAAIRNEQCLCDKPDEIAQGVVSIFEQG